MRKHVKRYIKFFWRYKLFSLALIALIAGLILLLAGHGTVARWVLAVAAIFEVFPLLWDMWQDLRTGRYGIDILAATAIIASVILKQEWAAIVVVIMLTGGQALEDYAERRAQTELSSLLENAPQTANVIKKGKTVEVKAADIHVGDKLLIKPGEVVPVDALVLEGESNFDESSLTGESLPQLKKVGAKLLSGSLNSDGVITAKAVATAEDSQYQQIIKLVRGAAGSQAPFVRLADRYSIPFTFVAYAIAVAVWVVSGQAIRFLEVIIVATPCPLLLAAPIALISGMARASRYGIIVKSGGGLERLAAARTIVFDKTGTLTTGNITVDQVMSAGSYKKDEVLALAASLEQTSNHVLAQAIVDAANKHKLKLTKTKAAEEISGRGIQATVKGRRVLVGNREMLFENSVSMPKSYEDKKLDSTAAYVAVNGELAGIITFSDSIRPETKRTLEAIRALGIKDIAMITGDNAAAANKIAAKLGIEDVHASALPADKLHMLTHFVNRPVAFVGDGVNDAPVLTASDVGIALGAKGSTAASESADMVVMLDDLSRVADGLEIAKDTFKIARQSILIGIGLSIVLMLIFATGRLQPLIGALLQEVVDVFVIFNALRAHLLTPSMVDQHKSDH